MGGKTAPNGTNFEIWRGGRVDYCIGLENRRGPKTSVGSNPTLAAILWNIYRTAVPELIRNQIAPTLGVGLKSSVFRHGE